jgi:hypothetical protein
VSVQFHALTRGNSPGYPLNPRVDGPQCRYGNCGEEKKYFASSANRTPVVQTVAHRCAETLSSSISRLKLTFGKGCTHMSKVELAQDRNCFAKLDNSLPAEQLLGIEECP